jgi:predicted extracellular nuclease
LTAQSGEADVLLVGDFNAYLNEDPIQSIEAGRFENLLKRLPATDRYSYVFKGQSGALDHAFASESLQAQVAGVTVWHINADEPVILDYNTEFKTDDRYAVSPFRSSDHDPVLVGLTLAADAPASAPTLDATLPTSAQAGVATVIHGIAATLSDNAAGGNLTIDWGDGNAPQALTLNATSASHTYAAAGTYTARLRLTESTGKTAELVTRIRVAPAADPAIGPELFFSEYVEGSSNNKALEIYNPTVSAVDLASYQVKLYANGATAPTSTHNLSGTLNAGATLVLFNAGITPAAAIPGMKITSAATNFNGDDAITLVKNSVLVDAIGQVGFDPGVEWARGDVSTANKTLRRKAGVVRGSIPSQAPAQWDIAAEWDAYPIDTFSGLGTR